MTQNIGPQIRADVLRIASVITGGADAVAIAINASPIIGWLEAARDEDDLNARVTAMRQHHRNLIAADIDSDEPPGYPGDTGAFLDGARVFHAFIGAGDALARLDAGEDL
ncbi:MAG: hypothetical protein M0030_07680 [Actinomycetota bacterium]|nr:hypothetical protein [Actinomycetota bacterium]